MSLRRTIATSDRWFARFARRTYRGIATVSLPAPKFLFLPLLWAVLGLRECWFFLYRVFFCEPLFKAYCKSYGRNLHTGVFLHWVQGKGDLIVGDNVLIDGKCTFVFAARFSDAPTLSIGHDTSIGHNCTFTVGKKIAIGNNCLIASGVHMLDAPGHPLHPERRQAGMPPDMDSVRPITIGNNVWLGTGAVVMPGVTIGDNSVVSMHALVVTDVPANVVVSGNPARKILSLEPAPEPPVPVVKA